MCDIGQRRSGSLLVTQTGGHLSIEPEGSELVLTRLDGGIWSDGRFDVGGLATQLGGSVVITARAAGTLTGTLMGHAQAHAEGKVGSDELDCTASFDLSGSP